MKYQLTDYNGNQLELTPEQADIVAAEADLLTININGQLHYMSKKSIASIKPVANFKSERKQLPAHDYRGEPSAIKEELRKKWSKK